MPNVAEIIRDHVTLQVRCVDRLYLNGYVPALQSAGGVVAFLRRACGQVITSPAGPGAGHRRGALGLQLTIYDPSLDPDRAAGKRLVTLVSAALAGSDRRPQT